MRPNRVTFDCCICGRAITGPDSAMHYCEECGDGPFCDVCYAEHRHEEVAWQRGEDSHG
ncbi:MAG: hypothetical protein WC565_08960 [Parcubacteria group bacterium]